ncbi:hypothetical protein K3495_g2561 [Podosphaera aphanis]|nr:hypothetical protein K3495_g2561 [Podosphaera aphanis]
MVYCDRRGEDYRQLFFPREITLWKSIILSSLNKTAFPYCLFIRSLELDKLKPLLRPDINKPTGPLDSLYVANMFKTKPTPSTNHDHDHDQEDFDNVDELIELVGDTIISCIKNASNASAYLERIKWVQTNRTLTEWMIRLPDLKTLIIADPLDMEDLSKAISQNCLKFHTLVHNFYGRDYDEYDRNLALFLNGLSQNTLQKLCIQDYSDLDIDISEDEDDEDYEDYEAILSINRHAESLTELKISGLNLLATRKLPLLSACKALTSLHLDFYYFDLLTKKDHNIISAIVDWICSCRNLRELAIGDITCGREILTHVCSRPNMRLEKLEIIIPIILVENGLFLTALSTQTTLEFLSLKIQSPESCVFIDNFISSLSCMQNLKCLDLAHPDIDEEGFYLPDTIVDLVSFLPRLERLAFYCRDTTDALWSAMMNLHHLRILAIRGITSFSFDGVIVFINSLRTTNEGLEIVLCGYEQPIGISTAQKLAISESLQSKVGGYTRIDSEDYLLWNREDQNDLILPPKSDFFAKC